MTPTTANTAAKIQLGIHGACGRMGLRIVQLAHSDPDLQVAAALERADHPKLGQDIGELAGLGKLGVPLTVKPPGPVDVLIDFSTPEATLNVLRECLIHKTPLVIATTGHTPDQRAEIATAAHEIPLLMAPNMSLAVNLLMKLVGEAAARLKDHPGGVDVEIIERHHRFKHDAPSGTALAFGKLVSDVMGQTRAAHGRQGRPGERPRDEIGYHALRTGDNVGEHTIVFGMLGETLELSHRAGSRDCYALGTLQAAKFLVAQKAGLYSMADVLKL